MRCGVPEAEGRKRRQNQRHTIHLVSRCPLATHRQHSPLAASTDDEAKPPNEKKNRHSRPIQPHLGAPCRAGAYG